MASQESPTGKKQEGNTALGCGCLSVIVLLIGWLATSCLGGSDEPDSQALPAAAPPTTTSSAPPITIASPTSSYALPPPAQPIADRDCADFSSRTAAQAALLPGDPEQLDPDDDGLACENYFARQNQPDPYVAVPREPVDDDSSGGTRPRSGQSGHPCGPGERDGDGDGFCGEG